MTAGRWPWRSAFVQKCVTTYLPNESAPKMDGAKPLNLILGGWDYDNLSHSVGGREDRIEGKM